MWTIDWVILILSKVQYKYVKLLMDWVIVILIKVQ